MPNKNLVKQDLNFLEYPLWFQDERLPEGFVWKDRDGFIYRAGYKPPVRIDGLYLCYFLRESQRNNWAQHIVVSQRGAMRACGVSPGKANALRLHDDLERWINITLSFQGTFYSGVEYQKLQFNVMNDWYLQKPRHHLDLHLNDFFIEKIKHSNFSKLLDLNILRKLKRPLALRLYEILLKNFMYRDEWSIDAHKLARKIPIAEIYLSQILKKLKIALEQINRYTDMTVAMTVEHYSRGRAMLTFRNIYHDSKTGILPDKGQSKNSSLSSPDTSRLPVCVQPACRPSGAGRCTGRSELGASEMVAVIDDDSKEIEELFELLPTEHRSKKTIRDIVERGYRKYGFDYVARNIRYTNQNHNKNYRAFLIKALKDDWGLELQEDEETKKERYKAQTKRERQEKAQFQRLKSVQRFIKNLSKEKYEKLRNKAISELGDQLAGKESHISNLLIRSHMEGIVERRKRECSGAEN